MNRFHLDTFWRDLWGREKDFLLSAKPEFRHGATMIGVSTIADQFYCEYKVENEFALGEVATEAKGEGTELHDELIPGVELTAKEFIRLVSGKKPSYAVLRVWGMVGGLRLVGMPDHIVWSEGRPLWLVELKTTKSDPKTLWDDQIIQARIYGLLLDQMGFDPSKLRIAVVRVKSLGLSDDGRRQWARRVSDALMSGRIEELESEYGGLMKLHVVTHDSGAAMESIAAKRDYWMSKREPTSSESVGKCRACEYNAVCPKSLDRRHESHRVTGSDSWFLRKDNGLEIAK